MHAGQSSYRERGQKRNVRSKNLIVTIAASLAIAATILFSRQITVFELPTTAAVTTTQGIGVYWDRAATNRCQSIYWGEISPGSKKTVTVFVKNEISESLFYLLTTGNWYPSNASGFMNLAWNYSGNKTAAGSILQVSMTLSVSPEIRGITNFNFDILVLGSTTQWGDVNGDGSVDIKDLAIIGQAFGANPGEAKWKPEADVNLDNTIDIRDMAITAKNFGKKFN